MSSIAESRFVARWASAAARERVWRGIACASGVLCLLSLVVAARALARSHQREVIRIGADGVPAVVALREPEYSDPNEVEMEAFARRFAEDYARADSYSVVNDVHRCASYMRPELRVRYEREMAHGVIAAIQSLKRRTWVDRNALRVQVTRSVWPWSVQVAGVRHVVGEGPSADEPFSLTLELVRADRSEIIEGLLVWNVTAAGDPVPRALVRTGE